MVNNVQARLTIPVEEIKESVRGQLADAWDQGATFASPYAGGYLRSILVGNPYRNDAMNELKEEAR